jgi:hypothetical protein
VIRGEITLQEEGKEKKTFKEGDRADVGARVKHQAWMGPQVSYLSKSVDLLNSLLGMYIRDWGTVMHFVSNFGKLAMAE